MLQKQDKSAVLVSEKCKNAGDKLVYMFTKAIPLDGAIEDTPNRQFTLTQARATLKITSKSDRDALHSRTAVHRKARFVSILPLSVAKMALIHFKVPR